MGTNQPGGLGSESNPPNRTSRAGIVALISMFIQDECGQHRGCKVDGNGQLWPDDSVVSTVPAECVFKVLRESNPERHTTTTCCSCNWGFIGRETFFCLDYCSCDFSKKSIVF